MESILKCSGMILSGFTFLKFTPIEFGRLFCCSAATQLQFGVKQFVNGSFNFYKEVSKLTKHKKNKKHSTSLLRIEVLRVLSQIINASMFHTKVSLAMAYGLQYFSDDLKCYLQKLFVQILEQLPIYTSHMYEPSVKFPLKSVFCSLCRIFLTQE